MKNNIAVRLIRTLRFIWREAKKPAIIQNFSLKMNLSPRENESRPLLTLDVRSKVRLIYVLIGLVLTLHIISKGIKAIFK